METAKAQSETSKAPAVLPPVLGARVFTLAPPR